MFSRRQLAALLGEFLGTAALTLIVLAVSKSTIGLPYFVALAAAVSLAVLATMFSTNGTAVQLNPAITLGLWTVRKIRTLDAVLAIALQLLGGFAALSLFTYFIKTDLPSAEPTFTGRVLVAEAVGAFVLAFAWAAAVYRGYRNLAFGVHIGAAYLVGIVIASAASAALLNPAIALGTNLWEWRTYVLGPVLGSLIGFNLYSLLFAAPEKVAAVAAETAVVNDDAVVEDKAVAREAKSEAIVADKPVVTTKKVADKKTVVKKSSTRTKRASKK